MNAVIGAWERHPFLVSAMGLLLFVVLLAVLLVIFNDFAAFVRNNL